MSNLQQFQPDVSPHDACCAEEQICFLGMRQIDIKPMLKALAGLCLFFGVMALVAACGALVVMAIKSLARLL